MIDPKQLESTQQAEQLKQLEEMKKKLLSGLLSREAFERLGRIRFANPTLAQQVELYLLQLHQQGRLKHVTDKQLKEVLQIITEKKETKITRR